MGVKMYQAMYENCIINLNQYEEKMQGKTCCRYCGAPISYVKEHIRDIGEYRVLIPAHFRIKSSKTNPHKEHCSYLTINEIKEIYANRSDDELMTKSGGSYILRLHLLTVDSVKQEKNGQSSNPERRQKSPTLKYAKAGNKSAYITTLKKILMLRNKLDSEGINEIKESLKLQCYNNVEKKYYNVPWDKFFFEYDKNSYLKAYEYILTKIAHPITFCGHLKSIDEPRENFKSYAFRISPVKVENNKYVCVTATFDSVELYEELKIYKGRNILIFGFNANSKVSKNKSNIEFLNINIRIYGKNQVLLIERE
ncbi:hypothetical protein EII17_09575 [Clostridiales bacterium COT073_COT-073]|nr:hypothetical protein EII17_09575 [Clostridiales bacterium COT073_COT-073]